MFYNFLENWNLRWPKKDKKINFERVKKDNLFQLNYSQQQQHEFQINLRLHEVVKNQSEIWIWQVGACRSTLEIQSWPDDVKSFPPRRNLNTRLGIIYWSLRIGLQYQRDKERDRKIDWFGENKIRRPIRWIGHSQNVFPL